MNGPICCQLVSKSSFLGEWKLHTLPHGPPDEPGVRDDLPPLVQAPPGRVHPVRLDDRPQLPYMAQGEGHGSHAPRRGTGRR